MKKVQIAKQILRLLIGCMFVAAAVMKLLTLDEFEIYIYSFKLFSYTFSTLAARVVVAAELVLGAFFIAKIFYRQVWLLIQAMLVGFSFLLIFVLLYRNDANCHCFGDIVQLNPVGSLVKNLLTIGMLFLIRKEEDFQFKGKRWFVWAVIVAGFVVPFVFFTPDAVYNKIKNPNDKINVAAYNQALTDSSFIALPLEHGRFMVGFFASGCKYCKQSLLKVNMIMERHHIPNTNFKYYIWGSDEDIKFFKEETSTQDIQHCVISPIIAINITSGAFPVYALVENGKIVTSFDYRGIDETVLKEFFSNSKIDNLK